MRACVRVCVCARAHACLCVSVCGGLRKGKEQGMTPAHSQLFVLNPTLGLPCSSEECFPFLALSYQFASIIVIVMILVFKQKFESVIFVDQLTHTHTHTHTQASG